MNTKRLFLFAAYDSKGMAGTALIFYIKALSLYGDVVVVMDNDSTEEETAKLLPFVKHIEAGRHGEYDFGSYKRAYIWSMKNLQLEDYAFCYLVNDSVYGPLNELEPYLQRMENMGVPAFGLAFNPHKREPHIQSWFVGMRTEVFCSPWFEKFITGVAHQDDMRMIYSLYEIGLTELFDVHELKYEALFALPRKSVYNSVLRLYRKGFPFIKKAAVTRHNGSLGREIGSVLKICTKSQGLYGKEVAESVIDDMKRVYGREYTDSLLRSGRLNMWGRYLKYLYNKIV